jgi:UDP-N-acetylmuramoyl-L-alanyl-D-glutamate--2,6-diaminopimelate ligase
VAVVNLDDPAGEGLAREARQAGASLIRVSRDADAEVRLESADVRMQGTRARVAIPGAHLELAVPLLGDFNLENVLVACGVAVALGIAPQAIEAGVAACPQVPGRVERVTSGADGEPTVLVDYAHTPDAVEKLLRTLRPLTRGRLIALFGCGGDRDRAKRSLMAEAVARWSDLAVATSDNPRSEDPCAILADVEAGLRKLERVQPEALGASQRAYSAVVDRRAAIALAIGLARPEDTVVLAGKGHEDYQIIGRERLPFDDREEARRALAQRGAR